MMSLRWFKAAIVGFGPLVAMVALLILLLSRNVAGLLASDPAPAAPVASAPPGGDGPCPQPALQQRAIVPGIDTNQDDVDNQFIVGGHPVHHPAHLSFKEILARGRHLFTTPFTEPDGAGEGQRDEFGRGRLGPREESFNSNLKLVEGQLGLPNSSYPKLLDLLQPPYSKVNAARPRPVFDSAA